jgi:hypothetical protein
MIDYGYPQVTDIESVDKFITQGKITEAMVRFLSVPFLYKPLKILFVVPARARFGSLIFKNGLIVVLDYECQATKTEKSCGEEFSSRTNYGERHRNDSLESSWYRTLIFFPNRSYCQSSNFRSDPPIFFVRFLDASHFILGIVYKRNELWIDVVESINLLVSPSGTSPI